MGQMDRRLDRGIATSGSDLVVKLFADDTNLFLHSTANNLTTRSEPEVAMPRSNRPVSYTHLTLPTKRIV